MVPTVEWKDGVVRLLDQSLLPDKVEFVECRDYETVGIAIMNHPDSFRYPTTWHVRDYGLFAANPFGIAAFTGDKTQDGSMTLEPGKSLRFRYRVIIHPGDYKTADIAKMYADYAAGKMPSGN